jgi:hypothetical protein
MFTDPSALAVDPRTPLAALIEAEDEQAGETLDLTGIAAIPPDALAIMLRFLLPDGRPTSTTGPGAAPQAGRFTAKEQSKCGIEEGLPSASEGRHLFEHFLHEELGHCRLLRVCCIRKPR